SPDGRSVLTASEDGLAALFPSGSTGPPKELVFSSDPPQRVTMASFSGDGRWLLTVVGKQVQLRSVQDRTRATWIKLSKRIRAARFSPDAKYVLIQGEGKLGLWRASGTFVAWLEGHGDRVQSAVFSRDSQRVLTASADGTARVWTLTGETLAVLRGHGAALMSARFSPDRTRIVTAAQDRTARIWVRHRAKLHRRLSGVISRRPWSADGRWFAIGGEAGPRLLDGRTWKLLRRLKGHNGRAVCGAFRPDGRQLLTCGKDGKLGIWDPASGNRLAMLDHHAPVWSATFSPDGRLILSGASKEVWVWRWTTLERSVLLEEEMGGAAVFSPDSRSLVSDSGALYGIEKRIWRKRHQLGPEISYRRRSRFSPDGQLIAQAGENERVSLYSVESGKRVGQLRGHTRRVREAVFSPDGQRIASASEDLSIRIWDRATRTQIHRLRGHTAGVDQLIFSRDGRWLVSVGLDRTVRLWDVARGVQLDLFEQTHLVLGVAFSPGGRLLAVQSMGDRVTIWDLRRTRLSARMAMRRARYLTGRVLDGWAVEPEPILLIPERIRTALYAATPPRPSDSGYFGWLTVYRKAAQQQRPNHSRRLLTERFEQSPDPLLQLFLTLVRGSWSLAGSRNRGRRTTEYKQLVRRYEAARKVVPNHPLVKQVSRLIKSNR
ncbi:WD40 repeat domain-containing protein, partial [Acidimicrobium ferrooxidans]|nr:WD40 repeat domain-containing protein [Acidimicrobium ferrooxidans]